MSSNSSRPLESSGPTELPYDGSRTAANEAIGGGTEHNPYAVLNELSTFRKLLLLFLLCLALFLDSVNSSSLFSAIPVISAQLDIPNSQSVWLLSAYQLTFAALLLVSGRASDLYNPKWVFVCGAATMSIFALVDGFIRSEIPMMVLRGLMGSGAALTVPAGQRLIVRMYPDPTAQARAIMVFGAMGGLGIVLGLLIGALFVSFVSWPWVFYFSAIVPGATALAAVLVIPNVKSTQGSESRAKKILRFRRLDLVGVMAFAAALILFIFAVTSGSVDGWGSATVIAPLVISVFLAVGFFLWEAWIPEYYAALPSKMWRYENFTILVAVSLVPVMWWSTMFLLFSWFWERVYGWSAINTAIHFLPLGLGIFLPIPAGLLGLQHKLRLKWVILAGNIIILAGTLLLPFANSEERYWRFAFPGFLLGTAGAAVIFATTNIALLSITPPEVSGIVAAVFNCMLQTGGAAGTAIVTSIQTSVEQSHGGPNGFAGRAAGLWFVVAFLSLITVLFAVFMKDTVVVGNTGALPVGGSEDFMAEGEAEVGKSQ